ncbi:MAG: UDP-glucose dehydrogenase family protein [Bacteriovoracaceae bacterium]
MKISVIGTGYVGLVSGTCLAEIGHNVTCIDVVEQKVKLLQEGKCPIYEIGLQEYLDRNVEGNRLSFSTSYESVRDSEAVFVAVGTPSSDDGSANLQYLYSAVDDVLKVISEDAIIVIKSTVPIGTGDAVRKYISEKSEKRVHVINNPEFLREGTAVEDFMRPDRIVIGHDNDKAAEKMKEVYEPLVRQGNPIYMMSNISAEMTKYAANCFLATKISFINDIAQLCDKSGADIEEVRKGIMSDHRIGRYFLYPGPGYGGSCFPKDVKALLYSAEQYDHNLQVIQAAETVNEEQKVYMFQKIKNEFGDLKNKTFAFWGVAFKAGTDDIRESPAISMAESLIKEGAQIHFYDPEANENFSELMAQKGHGDSVKMFNNKYEALQDCTALVTMTEWREFKIPDLQRITENLSGSHIFDARNLYEATKIREAGFKYFSIGKR